MAHPSSYHYPPEASDFERYNPATQSWEPQVPFPRSLYGPGRFSYPCKIKASAVWDDTTILLNIAGLEIWAYHVSYSEWYRVNLNEDLNEEERYWCLVIEGEAFVVGNTLYALSRVHSDTVLALSIIKEGVGRDLKYSCAFSSRLDLERMEIYGEIDVIGRSQYLFPLGKHLCFVRSCRDMDSVKIQPLQVSYIKLMEDGKMTLKDEYFYSVPLVDRQQFSRIGSCFSLPHCKTALKPYETFYFDPVSGISLQAKENVALHKQVFYKSPPAEGHGVVVLKLPPDTTGEQLEECMKKFGHIKRGSIQVRRHPRGDYATVEFESAAASRRAIEASSIVIGGVRSKIFQVEARVGSSRSSRRNLKRVRA